MIVSGAKMIAFLILLLPSSVADGLLRDIEYRIRHQAETRSHDLTLENEQGHITMYGIVDSHETAAALKNTISEVAGVVEITDRTSVATEKFDSRYFAAPGSLARRIQEAVRDSKPGSYSIQIKTRGGRVYISGNADSEETREIVLTTAASVPGVSYLESDISVPGSNSRRSVSAEAATPPAAVRPALPGSRSDTAVKAESIESKQERPYTRSANVVPLVQASLEEEVRKRILRAGFHTDQIKVKEAKGMVTLHGDVKSASEANRILSLVLMAEGVKSVDNHITVNGKPYSRKVLK